MTLTLEGTYQVKVRASSKNETRTGNYMVAVWDSTPQVARLDLNRNLVGSIENAFSIDRWTLAGRAGQQVQFKLSEQSDPGIVFSLTGPNGFEGFKDIKADSGLINLPDSGTYTITARGTGSQLRSNYSFRLNETAISQLSLNQSVNAQFGQNGEAQLYKLELAQTSPLFLAMDSASKMGSNELISDS